MTENHPITPPRELVQQWRKSGPADAAVNNAYEHHIATQAALWGYEQRGAVNEAELQRARDEELDACCDWLSNRSSLTERLRAARRPKPPSLKEQALETIVEMANCMKAGFIPKRSDLDTIRRALEQLDD